MASSEPGLFVCRRLLDFRRSTALEFSPDDGLCTFAVPLKFRRSAVFDFVLPDGDFSMVLAFRWLAGPALLFPMAHDVV